MSGDVYTLEDSEYEIIETVDDGPITSKEVKRKLEDSDAEPIDQDDFDDRDYTLSDYFWIDEDQYPRNFRDNKDSVAATAVGLGLFSGGHYILFQDSSIAGTALAAAPPAMYISGLRTQDEEIRQAFRNSMESFVD